MKTHRFAKNRSAGSLFESSFFSLLDPPDQSNKFPRFRSSRLSLGRAALEIMRPALARLHRTWTSPAKCCYYVSMTCVIATYESLVIRGKTAARKKRKYRETRAICGASRRCFNNIYRKPPPPSRGGRGRMLFFLCVGGSGRDTSGWNWISVDWHSSNLI